MEEKKDQPGPGDMGTEKKQWPDDIGKKGGSGEVDRRGGQGGPQPGTEKPSTEKKI